MSGAVQMSLGILDNPLETEVIERALRSVEGRWVERQIRAGGSAKEACGHWGFSGDGLYVETRPAGLMYRLNERESVIPWSRVEAQASNNPPS